MSASPINSVVVSRIVTLCGLKATKNLPDVAIGSMWPQCPGTIILDDAHKAKGFDEILTHLTSLRTASEGQQPMVILLSTETRLDENAPIAGIIDEVIAKPITTEGLLPILDRLSKRQASDSGQ
ncbi:response regulator [Mesorhizobium sp. SB112]|uniref:response regulator n=1 Tax=Mesorhizobium sp. SB112 TaxID=3151853 RepID=UPI0032654231